MRRRAVASAPLFDGQLVSRPRVLHASDVLEHRDPYREWRNPHEHRSVERELATLPSDYQDSCAYVRGLRPRGDAKLHGDALRFWNAPRSRAHVINALLTRGSRSLVQLQRDTGLPRDKLHQYLMRWGVDYRMRRRDITLIDPTGHEASGLVTAWHPASASATVLLAGYTTHVRARFDRVNLLYRTQELLPHSDSEAFLPARAAAALTGISEGRLKQLVQPDHRTRAGLALYAPSSLERVFPRENWRCTPAEAVATANPCAGCIFWDLHAAACGLGNPTPSTASQCEDYEPGKDGATA